MQKRKLLGLVALLCVMLIVPLVFGFGMVELPQSLFWGARESSVVEPASSTSLVFVDPAAIFDETLQSGNVFEVHVNISDVTDLFSWQINMSWDSSMLNVSRITAGEFLSRTASEDKTAAYQLGYVINVTDNAEGYSSMSESILGDVLGESGNGTLVSIEFLVIGYGSTNLTISLTGTLDTALLNSTMGNLPLTTADGYFSNKYPGDIDGDLDCDYDDFLAFAAAYLHSSGQPGYDIDADFDVDGDVDYDDFLVFAANYLKSFP